MKGDVIITISFIEHIILIMNTLSEGAGLALKTHREHLQQLYG